MVVVVGHVLETARCGAQEFTVGRSGQYLHYVGQVYVVLVGGTWEEGGGLERGNIRYLIF